MFMFWSRCWPCAGENEDGKALLASLKLSVIKGGSGTQVGRWASSSSSWHASLCSCAVCTST